MGVFILFTMKIGAAVAGAVLATTVLSGVASAAPMTGYYVHCGTGISADWCSTATSIPGGSATMSEYSCGSYSCSVVLTGTISNGDIVPLHCYTYGDSVGGDNIWILADGNLDGYFPDYYINTGSPADVKAHLYHC